MASPDLDMSMPMPDNMTNCTCMPMGTGMQMTFTTGIKVSILFDEWSVVNGWQMALSFLAVFVMAIMYELGKTYRDRYAMRVRQRSYVQIQDNDPKSGKPAMHRVTVLDGLTQTAQQAVLFTLAYLLMLIVMTYNVYLFLAVILGDALGYYLTLNLRPGPDFGGGDHCH